MTLLFTDIEGSTRLWEGAPEAMSVALRRHDSILREVIEAHDGHVFKTVGDAFCAAFPNAVAAVAAAVDAQARLRQERWPPEAVLRVLGRRRAEGKRDPLPAPRDHSAVQRRAPARPRCERGRRVSRRPLLAFPDAGGTAPPPTLLSDLNRIDGMSDSQPTTPISAAPSNTPSRLPEATALAMRFAAALGRYWLAQPRATEMLAPLVAVLERSDADADPELLGRASVGIAMTLTRRRHDSGLLLGEQTVRRARQIDNGPLLVEALGSLSRASQLWR